MLRSIWTVSLVLFLSACGGGGRWWIEASDRRSRSHAILDRPASAQLYRLRDPISFESSARKCRFRLCYRRVCGSR